jgi:hypothetical protein
MKGKSFFLRGRVAPGTPCVRRFAVRRTGPVLLFPAEGSPAVMRRRRPDSANRTALSIKGDLSGESPDREHDFFNIDQNLCNRSRRNRTEPKNVRAVEPKCGGRWLRLHQSGGDRCLNPVTPPPCGHVSNPVGSFSVPPCQLRKKRWSLTEGSQVATRVRKPTLQHVRPGYSQRRPRSKSESR